jgi:WhiB family redox-sensing transcriptional regulator
MMRDPYLTPIITSPHDWRLKALCRNTSNPDTWFAKTTTTTDKETTDKAKAICGWCPVQQICADTYDQEPYGIFGGKTAPERAAARGEKASREPDEASPKCGTTAGYYEHKTRREPTCAPCKAARNARERENTRERNTSGTNVRDAGMKALKDEAARLLSRGYPLPLVAKRLDRTERTIQRWRNQAA